MFENIGQKIKLGAKILFGLHLAAIWIMFFYVLIESSPYAVIGISLKPLPFFLVCVLYSLINWFFCLLLCGFGDLIETNNEIRKQLKEMTEENVDYCPYCLEKVYANSRTCPHCGRDL